MDIKKIYDSVYRVAAGIVKEGNQHAPMIFAFMGDNERPVAGTVLPDDKDLRGEVIGRSVAAMPVGVALVVIDEAWARFLQPGEEVPKDGRAEGHPESIEVVTFSIFSEGKHWFASCKIKRPENDLEKAEIKDVTDQMYGRMVPVPAGRVLH